MCKFLSCTPEHQKILPNPAFQQEMEYKSKLITIGSSSRKEIVQGHSPKIYEDSRPCLRDFRFPIYRYMPTQSACPR